MVLDSIRLNAGDEASTLFDITLCTNPSSLWRSTMELLGLLFAGKPLNSVAVAAVFVVLCFARRCKTGGANFHSRWPLAAVVGWLLYGAWEWLILVRTPEANIRIDLLLIYPSLGLLSLWALYRLIR